MSGHVVALCGGVGGAKLAHGLAMALPPTELSVIVNTGDDFRHLGLYICPDLDSVMYALAGVADPVRGWGRRDETWSFMEALRAWAVRAGSSSVTGTSPCTSSAPGDWHRERR